MNEQHISLSLGLINGILQYLGTRPYAEVHTLIQTLQEQAIPQVQVPKEAMPEEAAAGGTD